MQTTTAQEFVQSYLDAFGAQDSRRCVDMYTEDAKLEFGPATYQGRDAVEEWHKARFAANLQIVRVDDISANGDVIVMEGVITSKRLKAWRIGTLPGRATFHMRDGKIADARFGLRSNNPLGAFRS